MTRKFNCIEIEFFLLRAKKSHKSVYHRVPLSSRSDVVMHGIFGPIIRLTIKAPNTYKFSEAIDASAVYRNMLLSATSVRMQWYKEIVSSH